MGHVTPHPGAATSERTIRERPFEPLPPFFRSPIARIAVDEPSRDTALSDWYRIGDGFLLLSGSHADFRATTEAIFGGCRTTAAGRDPALPCVRCEVNGPSTDGSVRIRIADGGTLDLHALALALFAERGYVAGPALEDGWRTIAEADSPGSALFAVLGDDVIADAARRWEGLVASMAISRLIARQAGTLFFHAASTVVAGRGVMLCGPKRAGKTTLAAALAARGHALLGDEIAAVRVATRELLPVRRALSLRDGPASEKVRIALAAVPTERVVFPDDEVRTRVAADALFPAAAMPAPLSVLLRLDGFDATPSLVVASSRASVGQLLTPMAASVWGPESPRRALQLLRLQAATRGYILRAGAPDETARFIEALCHDL